MVNRFVTSELQINVTELVIVLLQRCGGLLWLGRDLKWLLSATTSSRRRRCGRRK
jgi:hypothetical protein